jgi:hypothetical protein
MTASVPLATILARVTAELRRVEARLSKLEHAIGDIILEAPLRSARFHELQEIDHARQEVGGIAEFLDNMALETSPEWMLDSLAVSRSLKLDMLAGALGEGDAKPAQFNEYEAFD